MAGTGAAAGAGAAAGLGAAAEDRGAAALGWRSRIAAAITSRAIASKIAAAVNDAAMPCTLTCWAWAAAVAVASG